MQHVFDTEVSDVFLCDFGTEVLADLIDKYGPRIPLTLEVFDYVSNEIEAQLHQHPGWGAAWVDRNRVYAVFAATGLLLTRYEFELLYPEDFCSWRNVSRETCRVRFQALLNYLDNKATKAA